MQLNNLDSINLELLRTFAVAARAPTFAAAAKTRGVSVSAVSQQVKALEAQLGLALFERVGRNVRITSKAAQLATVLELHLKSMEEAIHETVADQYRLEGTVTMAGPRTFSAHFVTSRFVPLLRKHPQLQVVQRFEVPSVAERLLLDGHLDLAILTRPPELSGLAVAPLFTETLRAVASPQFAKLQGVERTELALSQWRWLIFDDDLPMHSRWWKLAFGRAAKRPLRVAACISSLEHLLDYARAGIGCAVLPDYLIDPLIQKQQLVEIVAADSKTRAARTARNTIFLAWRQQAPRTARVQCVKDALLTMA